MRAPEDVAACFRAHGLKVTPQRYAVFEVLAAHGDEHLSAEDVYDHVAARMPTVSLRTIYETLHQLVDVGELHPLDPGTSTRRYDTDTRLHAHLACPRCGRVQHVPLDLDELAERLLERGLRTTETDVVAHQVCPDCETAVTTTTLR